MNQPGIDLLKNYEGFRGDAYLDLVGRPTIGYGFTKGVKLGDTMTTIEADARLKQELAQFEALIDVSGTPNQTDAMTCLAYNIGAANFNKSTVKRLHELGNFAGAADAFRMWDMAGGRIVPGLIRRREAERALYLA